MLTERERVAVNNCFQWLMGALKGVSKTVLSLRVQRTQ